jgi:hypothetical protein
MPNPFRRRPPPLRFSRAELAALWIRAGGNPGRAQLAAAVALAESAGIPDAVGEDQRAGLWQPPAWGNHHSLVRALLNPLANAQVTVTLTKNGDDWSAFPGYTNGTYLRFLPQ